VRRLAVIAALALPATAQAHHAGGCETRKCHQRVDRKQGEKKKRAAVRPYRAWLKRLRGCESGHHGLYRANTGNGFYGAYQFTLGTWRSVGGRGMPHLARPLEQDYRAVRLRQRIGNPRQTAGWPVCG
jgi:hypothetical protein